MIVLSKINVHIFINKVLFSLFVIFSLGQKIEITNYFQL